MKRAFVLILVAALSLGGCSGKKTAPDAPPVAAAAAVPAKPNPWNKDPAVAPPVIGAVTPAPAKPGSNPWAKDAPTPATPAT